MSTRRCLTAACLVLAAAPLVIAPAPIASATQNRNPAPYEITTEMLVPLVLKDRLVSGTTKEGSPIRFEVDANIADGGGHVLIRKGTPAVGTVTRSKKGALIGRKGELEMSVDYTTAVDGQRVPLRGSRERSGQSRTGASIAAAVLFTPVALLVKGTNVTIKPGAHLSAWADESLTVKLGGAVR